MEPGGLDICGELRDFRSATTASFNALRQDFVDLRSHVDEQFAHIDEQFARINDQFNHVGNGFAEIRGRLDGAAAGQQQIVDLIQRVLDKPAD